MAEIFLARVPTELGGAKLFVVKKILPEFASNSRFCDLLITEAKLAARLTHANVVQVVDLGRVDDELFIAMEYVEGFDLNDLLRQCSRQKVSLPVEFALLIVTEALRGLDYAHRRTAENGQALGIIHRDVSPSNILISVEGEVKVCDFGIAHANDVTATQTEGTIQGKAGYMSPEQARGESLDVRADVFSVGVILWELLAGRRMYRASENETLLDVAKRGQHDELPSRDLPEEQLLTSIVEKALASSAADRYPSASAMLRDLEQYIGKARLIASSLRLGNWLRDSFGAEMLERRRMRETVARALEKGPPVRIEPISMPAAKPAAVAPAARAEQISAVIDSATESQLPLAVDVSPPSQIVAEIKPEPPTNSSIPNWIYIVVVVVLLAGVIWWQTQRLTLPMSPSWPR